MTKRTMYEAWKAKGQLKWWEEMTQRLGRPVELGVAYCDPETLAMTTPVFVNGERYHDFSAEAMEDARALAGIVETVFLDWHERLLRIALGEKVPDVPIIKVDHALARDMLMYNAQRYLTDLQAERKQPGKEDEITLLATRVLLEKLIDLPEEVIFQPMSLPAGLLPIFTLTGVKLQVLSVEVHRIPFTEVLEEKEVAYALRLADVAYQEIISNLEAARVAHPEARIYFAPYILIVPTAQFLGGKLAWRSRYTIHTQMPEADSTRG